jgi:hypothetical protein
MEVHALTVANSPQDVEPFDQVFFCQILTVLEEVFEGFRLVSVDFVKVVKGQKSFAAFGATLRFLRRQLTVPTAMAGAGNKFFLFT